MDKELAEQAFELVQNSNNILLHLHPKPDPDSIGSVLAMYHALRSIGKKVTVIKGDSVLPQVFKFLPGYEDIIHQNYFETDLAQFDLFIIQDSGSSGMISRQGEIVFPMNLKTLVIDHHITNTKFAKLNMVNASYGATAELLFDLFIEWGIEISKDIAICLYIGIYGDTGGFRYSNTTPRTMSIISKLTEIYPNFPELIFELEYHNTRGRIMFDALAMSLVETFFDDRVAISVVPYAEIQKRSIKTEEIDNNLVANNLITVRDWELGITLIEKDPNEISVSLRTRGKYTVDKIAEALGGGGHTKAAGAFLRMSLEKAKQKVLEAIKTVLG